MQTKRKKTKLHYVVLIIIITRSLAITKTAERTMRICRHLAIFVIFLRYGTAGRTSSERTPLNTWSGANGLFSTYGYFNWQMYALFFAVHW